LVLITRTIVVWSTDHKAPRYVGPIHFPVISSPSAQISSSAPYSRTP
jgi:hypothetical protein